MLEGVGTTTIRRTPDSSTQTTSTPSQTTTSTPAPTTTTPGVAERSAAAPSTANPTPVTAADTRARVNADPTTTQLRAGIEASLPAEQEEADELAADASLEEAQAFAEENPLEGNDPNAWSQDQRDAYNIIANDWGKGHIDEHHAWHMDPANGSGGTTGPGSGEEFLRFHREMMTGIQADTGLPVPGEWDPSTPIPEGFEDPAGTRRSDEPNVSLPAWLTTDGTGTEAGNEEFGETVEVDDQSFSSLADFENPDQLGRAIGESGYHASAHVNIGGTMSTFDSPLDPTFYAWHGHIDGLVDQWLGTKNGQKWAAANPDSPLLNPGSGHDHHA